MTYRNQYTRVRWIDGRGVKTSVGLPSYLFNLLLLNLGTRQKVREWVKERADSYTCASTDNVITTRSHWLEQQAVLLLLGVIGHAGVVA